MRIESSAARRSESRAPRTHPAGEVLADYTAGQLHRFQRWLVEAHLAYCPACRGLATAGSRAGGRWMEQLPATPLADGLSDELWQRLESKLDDGREAGRPWPGVPIPAAVRDEVERAGGAARWQPVGDTDSRAVRVAFDPDPELEFFIVRTPAGSVFPWHRHLGGEDLLVIRGRLADDYGRLREGDFWRYPPGSSHAPRVGSDEECIALSCVHGGLDFESPG